MSVSGGVVGVRVGRSLAYLGADVIAPQQADGQAQQAYDGPLHQEAALGGVHTQVAQVLTHGLPYARHTVPGEGEGRGERGREGGRGGGKVRAGGGRGNKEESKSV